jgi:hypothetical protein
MLDAIDRYLLQGIIHNIKNSVVAASYSISFDIGELLRADWAWVDRKKGNAMSQAFDLPVWQGIEIFLSRGFKYDFVGHVSSDIHPKIGLDLGLVSPLPDQPDPPTAQSSL